MRSPSLLRRMWPVAVAAALVASFALGGTVLGASGIQASAGRAAAQAGVAGLPGLDAVAPNALPAAIPGARWLVVGPYDATDYGGDVSVALHGGVLTAEGSDWTYFPLDLPAGAVIKQVDVYCYMDIDASMLWSGKTVDATTGSVTTAAVATCPSGLGIRHGQVTYASGLPVLSGKRVTLAVDTTLDRYVIGAIVQYTVPTNVLVPIAPIRVFDSRLALFGNAKIVKGTPKTINIKNSLDPSGAVILANAVPQGAVAVAYNLTVTGTVNSGYVALLPAPATSANTSSVNWSSSNFTVANGGVVRLGTGPNERQLTIVVDGVGGAATHVIVDITGYYVSES